MIVRRKLESFRLEDCHWEPDVCRVCGAPLHTTRSYTFMPAFCSKTCRIRFNTIIRHIINHEETFEQHGASKCTECGRFFKADGEKICPECRNRDPNKHVAPSKADAHKPKPLNVRMCHDCKKRKAAPGSYWCAKCKAKRNIKYHINPNAWDSGDDPLYGMYSDGRRITARGSE